MLICMQGVQVRAQGLGAQHACICMWGGFRSGLRVIR